MIEPTDDDVREALRRSGDTCDDDFDGVSYVRLWASRGRRASLITMELATSIAILRVAVAALECISASDPEVDGRHASQLMRSVARQSCKQIKEK